MKLNRNPENYFAEVEQSAFSPANVVPGISHSPDKMLQFRIFSYADAHRYRLGVNYESLPVNRPREVVHRAAGPTARSRGGALTGRVRSRRTQRARGREPNGEHTWDSLGERDRTWQRYGRRLRRGTWSLRR